MKYCLSLERPRNPNPKLFRPKPVRSTTTVESRATRKQERGGGASRRWGREEDTCATDVGRNMRQICEASSSFFVDIVVLLLHPCFEVISVVSTDLGTDQGGPVSLAGVASGCRGPGFQVD